MNPVESKERLRNARDAMYRELILDTAEEVFAEHGYEATRMQDVATRAGVSTRTMYATFGGKGDLFAAVHERREREILDALGSQAPRGPALDRLLAGITAYAMHLMAHPSYLRILGHAKLGSSNEALPSGSAAWTADRGLDVFSRSFAEGIREGVFRDEDPRLLGRLLHAMHQVRLLDWLERGMVDSPERVARSMREELICAFCRPELIVDLLGTALEPSTVDARVAVAS